VRRPQQQPMVSCQNFYHSAARAHWEELSLRRRKQTDRPNEVDKPLTEEEEAELKELTYRFHPLGSACKAWDEAAAGEKDRVWSSRRRRPRPNQLA
jgi:hypothetical protein